MPLDRRDIEAALLKKGFEVHVGDHRYYRLFVDGQKTSIVAKISVGTSYKVYSDELLAKIARGLRIKKAQLVRLVECEIDGPAYVALARESGEL